MRNVKKKIKKKYSNQIGKKLMFSQLPFKNVEIINKNFKGQYIYI